MKKDRLLELIAKLNKYEISNEDVTLLLQQDEKIIEKIIDLEREYFQKSILLIKEYQNINDILMAIDLLFKSKYYYYTLDLLLNKNSISAGISLEGAKIIIESKNWFNDEYASYVLRNENAIKPRFYFVQETGFIS